ncbi:hypothetical protein WA1_46955 [Scytonema hofmannii PCC 7110]|uniref:DUF4168 domain-containing protein n=1 Tax=Scytonema hofmannii PCC 7110 TaxID=128403 RepID=A0A139WXP0_9CYAN|nr:DUF4168 domain-containing protein [Scytonema hofmannii]KYC37173.1 hypothetical protein WA1_46955 [Scytonema hofmannii PCC 7110]
MFKQLLTGSCIFLFLLVGNLSVQAQPKPVSPSSSPQSQPPASNTPTNTQVSSEELQKFARTIKQLIGIEQNANQEMSQTITKSGLSQQRFMEIYKSQKTPSAQPTQAVSSQEKQQFEKAFTNLRQIQQQAETKMKQVLQTEGLQPERFNQIEAAVRQDPALQKKVREMIKG